MEYRVYHTPIHVALMCTYLSIIILYRSIAVCSHCASSQSDIYQKEMTHLAQLELKFSKLWRETRLAWMETGMDGMCCHFAGI